MNDVKSVGGSIDLIVVGGGIIGAGVAWRAAAEGQRVVLVDPKPGSGASNVAGGMLAPISEAWPGEDRLFELSSAALKRWPSFAAELKELGHDPGLRTEGTLLVGVDAADKAELDRLATHLGTLGCKVEPLVGWEVRALEPSLGRRARVALAVPDDLAVDNRRATAAVLGAGRDAGVVHVARAATAVRPGEVDLADGSTLTAETAVIAAGAWSRYLHPALADVIRPLKGEILRLRARSGSLPPPTRTIRGLVQGHSVYLVPRDNGNLVLGATQYEAGFEDVPRAGGVRDLIVDAEQLMPGIADYALIEAGTGLLPGSPDNLPVMGWLEPGVLAMTGHSRNGILLSAISADVGLDLLHGKQPTIPLSLAVPASTERSA